MQHIVLLEDNAIDAELIERSLVGDGIEASIDVAEDRAGFEHLLERTKVDLVISDSAVGEFSALDAVRLTKAKQPQSGFIVVSGNFDSERAAQAREAGAIEWLAKTELTQLPPLARLALEASEQTRQAENARAENARLTLSNQSIQRLVQAVTQLSAARDVVTIQNIVRTAAREINGADGATFVLRDGDQCYYAAEDAIAPLWKGQRFPIADCISGWAMINRRPAIVSDTTADPRISQDEYRPTFVKSLVMAPIRVEAPIGAIGNYWAAHHVPTTVEVQLIQALADATSIALENVELYLQLERRVVQRTRRLEEANQSLDEFNYFVAHDLRAPVRHVNAFAAILEAELSVPTPMAQKSLDKIKVSTHTMNTMIDGLLALSRLGAAAIESANVNMTALAHAVAQAASEQSAVPVTISVDELPTAIGSETLLRQVWTHLLSNAVKFSAQSAEPTISIGKVAEGGQIRYFVRDNGVGFDMAKADRLFMAFRRLHSEEEFSGAGVGLAIVNRIVSRHGGRVWAQSEPDKGATFYFTLGNNESVPGEFDDRSALRASAA